MFVADRIFRSRVFVIKDTENTNTIMRDVITWCTTYYEMIIVPNVSTVQHSKVLKSINTLTSRFDLAGIKKVFGGWNRVSLSVAKHRTYSHFARLPSE